MRNQYRNYNPTIRLRRQVMPNPLSKALTPSRLKDLLFIFSLLFLLYLLFRQIPPQLPLPSSDVSLGPTERRHLVIAVASSSRSWPLRKPYVRQWYSPKSTRAFVFLDKLAESDLGDGLDSSLPPVIVSEDTSRFPYSFRGGLRSAIRVARVVKEVVDRGEPDVRWFVFGDDDTVFFVDNLVKTLSKYDHDRWFYVGSNSESYQQNVKYSFDMAFGGGGFAISHSLAKALAKVFDSCLVRYAHLYGSDARIFSCVAELGVGITHEPGFHQNLFGFILYPRFDFYYTQLSLLTADAFLLLDEKGSTTWVDLRGNLLGMLSAHPLSPLLSLHHLDAVDSIFPKMNRTQAFEHLFEAVNVDPTRILQQTVCYDSSNSLTVSVAWGYAIQVIEGNKLLPDLFSLQKTFTPWRRSGSVEASQYMFTTRDYPRDACKRPAVYFMESVTSVNDGIQSNYARFKERNCPKANAIENLQNIRVYSKKLELDIEQLLHSYMLLGHFQMKAIRRQCCDILPAFNNSMIINIRQCGEQFCHLSEVQKETEISDDGQDCQQSMNLHNKRRMNELDLMYFEGRRSEITNQNELTFLLIHLASLITISFVHQFSYSLIFIRTISRFVSSFLT
ncbi:hypothetical protein F8388_015443 [Cannabis sativa]|uniref:Uncharacterized protein n=1 Tax=Cannabis sativa TaxID=3483 RepID=A0A7J6GI55_CANSA|nr:hypothetical protein F8388_015443 [Cannabis sativa]